MAGSPHLEAVQRAARESEAARDAFLAAVREAHAAGVPLRRIAEAAGLSHQRIHQLVRGE